MSVRTAFKEIIEEQSTRGGRLFDLTIQVLIVYSLVSICLETMPNLDVGTYRILELGELVVVIFFTAEYLLRIWVSDSPFRFVTSASGIVDLLAIAPFYLATGIDLRSIRVLRLLRILRLLKLSRYSRAMDRIGKAFRESREEFAIFFMVCLLLIFVSSLGIYYFEHDAQPDAFASVPHSFWWAVSTLSTVGYGDVYPITTGGRIFTGVVILIGTGVITLPAGILAAALRKRD